MGRQVNVNPTETAMFNFLKFAALTIAGVATVTILGLALCAFAGITLWAAPLVGTVFLGTVIYANS